MTDQAATVQMLAEANMRYAMTVHDRGTTIVVQGRRDQRLPPHMITPVVLEFNPQGKLANVFAER